MRWKSNLQTEANLYVILDAQVNTYDELFHIVGRVIENGVDIIQLRDKNNCARDILNFSQKIMKVTRGRIPFIVNDRIDIAVLSGAEGVHVGQDDLSVAAARKMLGPKAIIGASCQSMEQAQKAVLDGADYIGFGSVFKTQTKPDREEMALALLKNIYREIDIPIFAIGGINVTQIPKLKEYGVNRFAVCRDICLAEDVALRIRCYKDAICDGNIISRMI